MSETVVGTGLRQQARPIHEARAESDPQWPWIRLKYIASINEQVLPETTDPKWGFRYIDIGGVTLGKINEVTPMVFGDAPTRARRLVRQGDIIVSTVRTYLKAIARIEEDANDLVCSTGFAVVTAGPLIDRDFLYLWLISRPFVEEIAARSTGVGYPAVTATEVGDIACPVPPLGTQRSIATALLTELGSLDHVREALVRTSRLLDERAESLITTGFLSAER